MFGYVTVNKPEIKFKDFDMYRSFLLRTLQRTEGKIWHTRTDLTDL